MLIRTIKYSAHRWGVYHGGGFKNKMWITFFTYTRTNKNSVKRTLAPNTIFHIVLKNGFT